MEFPGRDWTAIVRVRGRSDLAANVEISRYRNKNSHFSGRSLQRTLSKLFAHRSIYFNVFGIQILYKLKLLTMTGGCNRHATSKNNKVFSRIRGHTICRTNAFCFFNIPWNYFKVFAANKSQPSSAIYHCIGYPKQQTSFKDTELQKGKFQLLRPNVGGSNLFEVKIQAEQMQYPENSSK